MRTYGVHEVFRLIENICLERGVKAVFVLINDTKCAQNHPAHRDPGYWTRKETKKITYFQAISNINLIFSMCSQHILFCFFRLPLCPSCQVSCYYILSRTVDFRPAGFGSGIIIGLSSDPERDPYSNNGYIKLFLT